jgi:D-sedoheptulose 7-phosphate isomerase
MYIRNLLKSIKQLNLKKINILQKLIIDTHIKKGNIFICGNGGSGANANHIANDLMLGFTKKKRGFSFLSLNANVSVITCIANDLGYHKIFSHQLKTLAKKDDLLIVLSGSGNSKNIINAINTAKKMKIKTYGILGYNGGAAKKICDFYYHININDMQISEDMQMIILNFIMKSIKFDQIK